MPTAPLRPCTYPGGCGTLVPSGRCKDHERTQERARGTARSRGYGTAWESFRARFKLLLIRNGIAPVCGASLPAGPDTARFSRCHRAARLNPAELNLDHQPPLTAAERAAAREGDRRAIDNPHRVGFLCRQCHSAKTLAEQQGRKDGARS